MRKPNRQMIRLRMMLDAEGIPWHDDSDEKIVRTHSNGMMETAMHYHNKVCMCATFSVICGEFTYGAPDGLEAWMYDETDPCGYETAEEVMERIREAMSE